jgi:hypothetical protein
VHLDVHNRVCIFFETDICVSSGKFRRQLWASFLFLALQPLVVQDLLIHEVSRSHTTTIGLLPDNTQHLEQTNIHASGGFRNHNLNRRAVLDRAATRTGMGFLVVSNKLIIIVINRISGWSYFAFFASCCNQPPVYRTESKLVQLFKKFPPFVPHQGIARVFLWSVCWTTPVSFRTVFRDRKSVV